MALPQPALPALRDCRKPGHLFSSTAEVFVVTAPCTPEVTPCAQTWFSAFLSLRGFLGTFPHHRDCKASPFSAIPDIKGLFVLPLPSLAWLLSTLMAERGIQLLSIKPSPGSFKAPGSFLHWIDHLSHLAHVLSSASPVSGDGALFFLNKTPVLINFLTISPFQ